MDEAALKWEEKGARSQQQLVGRKRKMVETVATAGGRPAKHQCSRRVEVREAVWPEGGSRAAGPRERKVPATKRESDKVLPQASGDLGRLFTMAEELGRGHFGVVRKVVDRRSGEQLACKTIQKKRLKTQLDVDEVRREVAVMEALAGHANVVALRGVFETQELVHIVMELCEGGELFDEVVQRQHYEEMDAAPVFRQLAKAVAFCHSKNIFHRDLKPENVLLATRSKKGQEHPQIKLADFGLALFQKAGEKTDSMAGSPFYMAPEILTAAGRYSREADVWSMGVILYILLCGVPPFWGPSESATFDSVRRATPEFNEEAWNLVSPEAKSLVRDMLTVDPRKRLTAVEVLSHPWLVQLFPEVTSEVKKGSAKASPSVCEPRSNAKLRTRPPRGSTTPSPALSVVLNPSPPAVVRAPFVTASSVADESLALAPPPLEYSGFSDMTAPSSDDLGVVEMCPSVSQGAGKGATLWEGHGAVGYPAYGDVWELKSELAAGTWRSAALPPPASDDSSFSGIWSMWSPELSWKPIPSVRSSIASARVGAAWPSAVPTPDFVEIC